MARGIFLAGVGVLLIATILGLFSLFNRTHSSTIDSETSVAQKTKFVAGISAIDESSYYEADTWGESIAMWLSDTVLKPQIPSSSAVPERIENAMKSLQLPVDLPQQAAIKQAQKAKLKTKSQKHLTVESELFASSPVPSIGEDCYPGEKVWSDDTTVRCYHG